MNIIFSSSYSTNSPPLVLEVTRRRFFIVLVIAALTLSAVVYMAAQQLAAHWLQTRSPIALAIAKEQEREADIARQRMWEENIDVLQEQIADVQAGIIAVQNRGKIIASRIGLPEEKFFSGTSLDNSCETLPSVTQVPESIDETAALGADKMSALQRSLQGITRRYDILAVRGTQQRVAFDTVPMQQPLEKKHRQTSGFGYRKDPFTGRRAFHSGYDYSARRGTPVLAAATGFVTYSGRLGNYGKAIRIFHGDNISTLYGHLHATGVEIGQYVLRGEPIGEVGSTGRSTGSHLHYELRINNKPRPIARVIKELLAARNIHDDWDA